MYVMMKIAFFSAFLVGCGCTVVETGHRGIKKTFGEVQGEPLPEGFYTYNPATSDIIQLSVQEEIYTDSTMCFTSDTQTVTVTFSLTYYPDPAHIHELYKQFGEYWENKIIKPAVWGTLKDAIGQYKADDLVSKREAAKDAVFNNLKEALDARHVTITRLDITDLDFDAAYEKAVEQKVIALQKSAEAKNRTIEIEEKAKQKIVQAEAEAKSMEIRSKALEANQGLVLYEMATRWNGVLPVVVSGGGSLLEIPAEFAKQKAKK